jgi:hypothetical protein
MIGEFCMKSAMKILLLVAVLFVMLAAVTPAYAGDVDGLWLITRPDQSITFAMLRENAGTVLMAVLDPAMNDWSAFYGTVDGATANLTTLASRWEQLGISITVLSPNSAVGTITSCTSTPSEQCESDIVGATFTFQKMF